MDQMSDANEYGAEHIRSGDMYLGTSDLDAVIFFCLSLSFSLSGAQECYLKVPTKVPHIAIEFPNVADTPKSVTLTSPFEFMSRFDGFMSL